MRFFSILLFLFSLIASANAQTGIIKGRISNKINNEAVGFANIAIPNTSKGASSDIDGNFVIEGLEPGLYNVSASFLGFKDVTLYEIQVSTAKPAIVNIEMEENTENLEEIVIKASPFIKTEESPVSLRTIGVAEIQRNPGGNRDISKVVQSLPGVTSTANFRNDLIIRGGAPNENRFYLDDVEVPNINHFATQGASGGPVGLINVSFIREVDFYSGAFPANRGNALSSVFNFKQVDGRDDRIGVTGMVGSSDAGITVEGPMSDKTTFLFSARRSYLQFLFKAIGLPFLPTYTDFQTKIKYKIDQKNEIYFIGLGAIDDFELNFDANDTETQQFILDQLPVNSQWNYTNGLVYKHYQDKGFLTFVLSRNMLNNEAFKYFQNDDSDPSNLILNYKSQEIENKFRAEQTLRTGAYKFNYGVGLEYVKYNNSTFNRIFTAVGAQTVDYFTELNLTKYNFFAQASRKFMDERLILSLGLRADGNSYSDDMNNPLKQLSPRFSLAYAFTEKLSFNFNTGIYYQLPPYTILGYQEDGALVNKENDVSYIQSTHFVGGLEYNTASSSKITLEGYYKAYSDYPFLVRNQISLANLGGDFGVIGNEPVTSSSEGRSYGLELLYQQRLYKGYYGIAAYTLGWSEFKDQNEVFVPTSWDSRHILNLTLGKKFGKNWEAGINWRFQSGLPFTPFADDSSLVQSWNVNNGPIRDFTQLNTERNDALNQVDIRVDKKWFFDQWSLNVYLDLENVFGASIAGEVLLLDRPTNDDGQPIGGGVIENPSDPFPIQRYRTKFIDDAQGNLLPSIGLMVEF